MHTVASRRLPSDPVTFTLTDAEVRAVLYACSVAGAHPELWNENETHRAMALMAWQKIVSAYGEASCG